MFSPEFILQLILKIAQVVWTFFIGFWWVWAIPLGIEATRRVVGRLEDSVELERSSRSVKSMKQMRGDQFERLCQRYFEALGYSARLTPRGADHGVDIILQKGDERVLVQCKRHVKPVGEPVIRDIYSAVLHDGASAGIVCASEGFTRPATDWARNKPITLVTGAEIIAALDLGQERPAG